MSETERSPGSDVQQCPSCGSTAVVRGLVEAGKVWFVCEQCGKRWSITDRRSSKTVAYEGPDRRRLI
jgi:transposase-like protein